MAYAIERKSNKLEVNDVQTKVRRLESLPDYDETTPSRTVVAINLPIERPTIESVAEIFSVCGEIVLVDFSHYTNLIDNDLLLGLWVCQTLVENLFLNHSFS